MPLAYLTFFTGIAISIVAIYYSVLGLAAIFAAAVIPIVIMGTTLEIAKLVTAWWLKSNWHRAPTAIKSYLTLSVLILMLITSMGIFGFLSKAHTDQNLISGDVQSKIALADEKIKIERENIANAQQVIKQMDAAVNGVIATGDQEVKLRDGTTQIRSAAERSLQIRRSQARDREALTKQIEQSQSRIVALQEEIAPIRAEMRKVEAEVGPIKYIAKLIYGDNPDQNILEKAVTWVIIIIVLVFDPLAVLMLLASQMSFAWAGQKERKNELVEKDIGEEKEQPRDEEYKSDIEGIDRGDIGNTESIIVPSEGEQYSEKTLILEDSKEKLRKFMEAVSEPQITNVQVFRNIDIDSPNNINQDHQLNAFNLTVPQNTPAKEQKLEETEDDLEAWNKMIEAAEKKLLEDDVEPVDKKLDENPYQSTKEDMGVGRPSLVIKNQNYVQNEEQKESNLWQESRKKVSLEKESSLSQEDYQKKVHQAIIKDLIKKIDSDEINIEDLTDEEATQIEEYLKKENDGR